MIHSLFPTYVYNAPLFNRKSARQHELKKSLVEEISRLQEIDVQGAKWCKQNYRGGYTSYSTYDKLFYSSSTFEDLRRWIDPHVVKFIKHSEMDIGIKDLTMTHCWVNVMPHAVTHTMHIHPLSVLSGTFYVSLPKGSGVLKIEDPRHDQFMNAPARKANAREENRRFVNILPQEGNVILFESWTRHEVPPNLGKGKRISVSFNYGWK